MPEPRPAPPHERAAMDPLVAGLPAAVRAGPAGPRHGRRVQALGHPHAAYGARRPGGRLYLPNCAVRCAQRVYVKGEQVIQIEGSPDSPISRGGRLCPKGSAKQWAL